MKFCSECDSSLPSGTVKFCPNCGTNLWQGREKEAQPLENSGITMPQNSPEALSKGEVEMELPNSYEGAWLAGQNDAKAGMIMPGKVEVGIKYYQEIAPGVAEDRAEIKCE